MLAIFVITNPLKPMKYLILKSSKYIRKIRISDIHCIISQDGQLTLEMIMDDKLLHCASLKELEQQLPDTFIRINRNVIINTASVACIQRVTKIVTLVNGREVSISRRQMPLVIKKFNKTLDKINNSTD